MVPLPAETLNSNPDETWTFVTRRRRGGLRKITPNHVPHSKILCPSTLGETSFSWTPSDSSTDPERESKLLCRMQSSIRRLDSSRFVRRFLSRLRDPQIQGRLHKLFASCSQAQIVVYGIGSIESYEMSRLQLALALRLKDELGLRDARQIEVFDPVLSAVECAVLVSLGCTVISANECGRRVAEFPTLFYMPHCEVALYDNLLGANWKPSLLRRMVVLGNSFGFYDRYASGLRSINESLTLKVIGRHLLGVMRYVLELEMEERDNGRVLKEDEEEVEVLSAFHDTRWHFFELDNDTDLDSLCK